MTLARSLVRLRGRLASIVGGPDEPVGAICKAPSGSMYLDQRGDVRACCQNAGFPLGNVTEASLLDIWRGDRAQRLRAAVAASDLSLGCNFCRWQIEAGTDEAVFAHTFDHLSVMGETAPAWPRQLELSLSNACNLQCVMCNGEWSSSIRTHREGLPPLPKVYDDRFFDELADFLPHLEVVKFLGGEPFLGAEPLRVMEMLAASAPHVEVHVTTNGTQWSPRIERILERLRVHVVVSLDGVRQDTYESIRVGSQLATVLDHVGRFAQYCNDRGTSFSLSHCLMTANWHEFDEFLDLGERLGCSVYVNTVTEPYGLSLYHLRPRELRDVVRELQRRDPKVRTGLSGRRLEVWLDQLARLGGHLAALEAHEPPDYVAKRRQQGFAWLAPPQRSAEAIEELDAATGASMGWSVELDSNGALGACCEVGFASDELRDLVERAAVDDGAHLLAADPSVPDDGSVVGSDVHRYDLDLLLADGSVRKVPVTRIAIRDEEGVLDRVRMFLDDPDPQRIANALASSPDALMGLVLDDSGVVVEVSGNPDAVLEVDAETLLGRQVSELPALVGGSLGVPDGLPLELEAPTGVNHQLQRMTGDQGQRFVHAVSRSVGSMTHLWLVLSE